MANTRAVCTCGGAEGAVRAANHWHAEAKRLGAELDRLQAADQEAMGIIRRAARLLLPESEQVTEAERLWVALSALIESCKPIGTMNAEVPLSAVAAADRALLGGTALGSDKPSNGGQA